MKLITSFAFMTLMATLLAGCAYKPLKAPCSPDEGGAPLAYSDAMPPAEADALKRFDRCGPMRPI
ncbi:hypothetical protein [Bradyrhizobium betae]|jgi:hypothetical protein|uniref:Lipoprotein n=1 Tax=Bradyrhizobium betae TaxID=244734 RepID=A0A5P6PGM2_9BRAD|nr:hypothetical protein [Bradyrhizobium betae]MBE0705004.1 hypothetical protein [Afipia sp.]MCS3731035.1 hypothetical protein [Bradyrhizobium betae]QFI77471.1 hypothetical protein F8237_34670 [Bradyrhizobium betae]